MGVLLTGCRSSRLFQKPEPAPIPAPTSAPSAMAPSTPLVTPQAQRFGDVAAVMQEQPLIILQVNFDILRARVPQGVFSESGKIWNHLDEESISAEVAATLQRNGLRVARGKTESWPPIQAILDHEKLETSRSDMTLANGLPLTVELDKREREQTLFLFRRDGTMAGVTCPMSRNLLRIEYEVPVTDASAVLVDVMPEIRQRGTNTLMLNELGQLDQPMKEPTRILRELAFKMEIPAGDFFVIGPSRAAHQGGLRVGSLLLCEEIEGKRYETMFFITPRVYRADRSKKP
jgi:hypothetical protein